LTPVKVAVPLAALLLLAAAACGGSGGGSSGGTTGASSSGSQPKLAGVPWVLASGIEIEGWEKAAPSMVYEAGKISGFGGCNDYRATAAVKGDNVDIGTISATRKACPEPGMSVEAAYFRLLGQVARYDLDGSALVLSDASQKELLRFSPANPARNWIVTGLLVGTTFQSVLQGTQMTAVVKGDGSIEGFAGCNTYTATATIDRNAGTISITTPEAGDKTCADDVMQQEQAYLDALPTVTRFAQSGNSLSLLGPGGKQVVALQRAS
jgi:heat shock protein HslJ